MAVTAAVSAVAVAVADADADDVAVAVAVAVSSSKTSSCSRKPEGRRPWMGGVFRPRQDAESENPCARQAAGFGRVGETFFFGSVSFGVNQKEMNSAASADESS
ncbi:hypothetical protein [Luteimonas fraxinea]|uniref:hypothetical protein n=1 Tax=Luteimonas fraxinea TaxID=2901869 RepID=UPI001E4326F5|nr:hypothetical protein [Luteimonas fraxinea]